MKKTFFLVAMSAALGVVYWSSFVQLPTIHAASAPTVDTVTAARTSGGSQTSFNLVDNATATLYTHGVITDADGCEDVAVNGTVTGKFYRTNHPDTNNCAADNNDCYSITDASCSKTGCTGPGDNTFNYECTTQIQYYADSTMDGPQVATDWTAKITAKDQAQTTGSLTDGIEMNTLIALDVPTSINYGSIALDAVGPQQTLIITNTGNSGLDSKFNVNGPMTCDGQGSDTIPAGNVHYSGTTGFVWDSGSALSTTLTEFELNLSPRTTDATPQTKDVFFKLKLPTGGIRGACTNTLTAVSSADTEGGW